MEERYTIFIDESGEAGIENVRSESIDGASPYMTLGACLIANRDREVIENTLVEVRTQLRKKSLHCSDLNHYQIIHYTRQIIKLNMHLFGFISRKETLRGYKRRIDDNSKMYYNKCVQYLLERVGWFMQLHQIPPENLDIVFEEARSVDYEKMRKFLRACQSKPNHENTKKLQYIDIKKITVKKKSEEPLLELADLVAHALYKCVDKHKTTYDIPEPRYLCELAPRFFGNPKNQIVVGAGLYCVHSTRDLKLDADVETILNGLLALPFKTTKEVE
ncbi:DUF3800 domain-containing protein [Bartonella sp. HY761]|uniref:DUF3800 domain-containing protein n=1 Tax=Bartonella sp. HY761 TaxID=2979330 RepID=UPI002207DFA9|nr:DUF3800 domain-containing protein [Bartonella sp. HY761]UXN06400.1 DUF3800 domain-containing protein [Bartonella sp. HY761]